jgi:hypothetical protein
LEQHEPNVAGGNGNGSNANQLYNSNNLFGQTGRVQKWTPEQTQSGSQEENGSGSNANQLNNANNVFLDTTEIYITAW